MRRRVPCCQYLAALTLAVVVTLGCAPARVDDGSFDVLIYVIDACRADRIGYYGYERQTTPAIDALAADPDAVAFMRHYVAGNWTLPATASLFTGKYVHQHGVTARHAELADGRYRAEVLADSFVTLAERFREAGYATYGLVTSHLLAPKYGFDQGFDAYFDPENLAVGDSGRIAKLIRLIRGLDSAYFGYVHQNACHYPFPAEDRDPELMATIDFEYDEESRVAAGVDFAASEIRDSIAAGETQLTEDDARFLSLVYDAKLRRTDREVVEKMIEQLRHIGRWDRTMFILTADHGEQLYEHGGYAHGFGMWEEEIHVPLIVKFPRGKRPPGLEKRIGAVTSNVDLFPSLMSYLGQPPEGDTERRSIFDSPAGGYVVSQGLTDWPAPGQTDWAVVRGQEKLIVQRDGRRMFFDLAADPGETRDLAASMPERLNALAAPAEAAGAGTTPGAPAVETELSPEVVERLRSLGYLD